ncbi:serine/threonine-protein kinase [Nesterenkonia sp. NBAIMH1]|uniref:serine/threonine-protein kinase n=1 Tax=Nesterenkonia sp. NBAIMH1 TaxID=2600320 RepID=UPI0011B6687E|nr:serine/threonine-protein kinase [Nesterenkonia sp. NBAIMH1]
MSEQVGRYRLEEVIGVGSFATVHRASDDLLGDTVVVKLLAENHSLNPEIRERFIGEGRYLRKIRSAAVVTVHDIGESARQQPYLVLEYADRGTLAERVRRLWSDGWRASPHDVLAFARPLAEALEAVHRAQLVHRDLSPGNLLLATAPSADGVSVTGTSELLRSDERLLLADLGMCKDLAVNSGLTVSGGTAGFRPPEQNRPGLVDARADIWSMSALLNWLTQQADLPESFHEVLRRSMSSDPSQRPDDAAEWLAEIEAGLAPPAPELQAPAQEPAPAPDEGPRPAGARIGLRRGALAVCAAALAAMVLGLAVGWLMRGTGELPQSAAGSSLEIEGPEEAQVGRTVSFEVEGEGLSDWVWLLPTGSYETSDEEISLTPTAPGRAEIVVRGRAQDGTELEARHPIRVVE